MKILLYRTVRTEEMGYVIQDVMNKYNNDCELTVITRPENKVTMEKFSEVNNVLVYSGNTFHYFKEFQKEIDAFCSEKFDQVIIPTNGNLSSYENVVKYNKFVFGNIPIIYYSYPANFINYEVKKLQALQNMITKVFSGIIAIPLVILFILVTLIKSIKL